MGRKPKNQVTDTEKKENKEEAVDTLLLKESVNVNRLIELFQSSYPIPERDYAKLVGFLNGSNSICYRASKEFPKGRMYSGFSLHFLEKKIRAFLLKDDWIDVDISQCHILCLYKLCQDHQLKCPLLEDYVKSERRDLKKALTFYLNDDDPESQKRHPLKANYKKEMDVLKEKICQLEKVDRLLTAIYRVEREAIDRAMKIFQNNNITINCYIFDGLIVDPKGEKFLDKINEEIAPLKMRAKPMEPLKMDQYKKMHDLKSLDWKSDYSYMDFFNEYNGRHFNNISEAHSEILRKALRVIRIYRDKIICKTDVPLEGKFMMATPNKLANHCKFIVDKTSFTMIDFLYQYSRLLTVNTITPKIDNGVKNCFSLFRGMAYKLVPEVVKAETKEERDQLLGDIAYEIDVFLHHIRMVICSDNDELYHHFLSWISFFLKHPYEKTKIAYIFGSTEGAGKSTLAMIIEALIGSWNVAHVCGLDKVTGNFNKHLANKMLVIIEELKSAKETDWIVSLNALKNILDNPVMLVEPKGIDCYEMENCLNFIGLTNYRHSVPAKDGLNRRFIANWSANIYKRDYEYFGKLQEAIKNPQLINYLGTYLYYYEGVENLSVLPSTELKEESQFIFKSEIEKALYILAFLTSANDEGQEVWISPNDVKKLAEYLDIKKLIENRNIGSLMRPFLGKRHDTKQKYLLKRSNDFEMPPSILKNAQEYLTDYIESIEVDRLKNRIDNDFRGPNLVATKLLEYIEAIEKHKEREEQERQAKENESK